MSRVHSTLLALVLLIGLASPTVVNAADRAAPVPPDAEVVPGEVLVSYRDGRVPDASRLRGLSVVRELGVPGSGAPVVLSTAGRPVEQVVAELSSDPTVARVEPNYRVFLADEGSIAVSVNDPKTGDQYSLDQMRVRHAWSLETGGAGVIAVLDTGVQANHPDLAGRLVAGRDFVNGDNDPADDNGHGTWVAGVIAAKANDAYGIAGVSWTDKVMPVKIMNREGTGTTAHLLEAIRWSADHGATVINMSVGGFPYSQLMQDAVNYAWNKGVVLVGAAGNNRREETYYPASFDNVISVSATQVDDEFSNWSSYGPKVDVSAPGSSVLTTNCYACTYADHDSWGSHTYISGTSFATPNVAGVVALIRARYPSYTPSQVVNRLLTTVDDLGYAGWDNRYGRGRVNAYRAVGASTTGPGPSTGDALEGNNSLAGARRIGLGVATRPSIHPASDVDWFAVDVPRAGRLDVRVTGVPDSRSYPWNKSPIPVDPVVELYSSGGAFIKRVDAVSETGTELAQVAVSGPTRIFVRVSNWYPNGNRAAYSITPSYVDTAAPKVIARSPGPGATNVSRFARATARFDEPVTNVSSSTVRLRDTVTGTLVPATVTYDAGRREAGISAAAKLEAQRVYEVQLTSGVRDASGNALVAVAWRFTTGVSGFADTVGNPFDYDIAWLAEQGITAGCSADRFCPKSSVTREQMASFLARGLSLPSVTQDHFSDDDASAHEGDINRIAGAGITGGCSTGRFCPSGTVTREQMASFLARALDLPPASRDYFADDGGSPHEADINRLAQAGITGGCTATGFCPDGVVNREQMAAFLHRALGD